ncbi:MAG: hypothetical protein IPO05_01085 [Flavobacteriales bacterium]|nr:hypothetical protein [Flavobacteriales bacterium]
MVLRARPGAFNNIYATLFQLRTSTNITIIGYGATFQMNRSEYALLNDSEFGTAATDWRWGHSEGIDLARKRWRWAVCGCLATFNVAPHHGASALGVLGQQPDLEVTDYFAPARLSVAHLQQLAPDLPQHLCLHARMDTHHAGAG